MITEISAGLNSLKAAKDIVQALNGIHSAVQINEMKLTLQGHLLDAQSGLFAGQEAQTTLTNRIADLEQEIMRLKDWSAEQQQYELADAGAGTLAYRKKAGMDGGEPPHWLCPTCYQQGKKSYLQPESHPALTSTLHCPACGTELVTRGRRENVAKRTAGTWGTRR